MFVSLTTICQISPLCHSLLHYSWDCLTATTAQENAGTNWNYAMATSF